MPEHRRPAASPHAGEAAALMSERHGWLRFCSAGRPLSVRLDADARPWQAIVLGGHRHWYGPEVPVQVAGAFVLQYLLQVPAHTAAAAVGVGMRVTRLSAVSFELGPGGVPRLVEVGGLEQGADSLEERLEMAESDYLEVAEPMARAYRSTRPMSTHQRSGMVRDIWAEAARAARARTGSFPLAEPRRTSCCLIYALPGCVECSGCPRLGRR
ncbi:MAG: (2Fe-2S)-binding protein [Dermatophilaceae bacterium]